MNGIQLFQNSHASDVIQMMWSGQINVDDIQDALQNLNHLTQNLAYPANLVVVVAADTTVPSHVAIQPISLSVTTNKLRGWMLFGHNKQANAIIHAILEKALPTN